MYDQPRPHSCGATEAYISDRAPVTTCWPRHSNGQRGPCLRQDWFEKKEDSSSLRRAIESLNAGQGRMHDTGTLACRTHIQQRQI